MNHLLRSLAPISDSGWRMLDDEARERLVPALAARKLVDLSGPHGWEHSAANLGRAASLPGAPCDGVQAVQRQVLPLVELRAPFSIPISELRDADRGAPDADLSELDTAAHRMAVAENIAVFRGFGEASIVGIADASPHDAITLGELADDYPRPVAGAVERLLHNGISGPYALALGGEQYQRVTETAEHGGYPLLEHLRKILEGPIVWTPGVGGAAVLSMRGGDFLFESGQDISIGYESHDGQTVRLYLEESFSFHVATPEAAVSLVI
ncbi:MAG: bacteriocin family protein [Actinomycetota bacterium]|nr:bacteriocin family protein [Actinomycetota bacterium]